MNIVYRVLMLFLLMSLPFGAPYAQQPPHQNPQKSMQLAQRAVNHHNYKQALEILNTCIQQNPYLNDAYFLRAETKEHLKDKMGAITDYSALLHLDPKHTEALFNRAVLRYQIGYYELASEDLKQLLTMNFGATQAVYYKQAKGDQGISSVGTMKTMKADIYNYLGLSEFKLSNFETAIGYFQQAIESDPENTDYLVNMGQVMEASDDFQGAEKYYEKALAGDPENTIAQYNLTNVKARNTDKRELISQYNKMIDNNPQFSEAYYQRALLWYDLKEYENARKDIDSVLLLDAQNYKAWFNRGLVKDKLEDYTGAIADFSKTVALKPDFEKAYGSRANAYSKMDLYPEALNDYNMALYYQPDNRAYLYNRALTYLKIDEQEKACSDLRRAINLGLKEAEEVFSKKCLQKTSNQTPNEN